MIIFRYRTLVVSICGLLLAACSTPTLVEVARRRQAVEAGYPQTRGVKDDVNAPYHITDRDVLNFTDEVKRKLANRANFHTGVRYGSAGTQATLSALAGGAEAFGWALSTASTLGAGATYIFGLGQIFDARGHAQAFEQAFTEIQAAEAAFYFNQLGLGFKDDPNKPGKRVVDRSQVNKNSGRDIPRSDRLTPDGETLYYKVTKQLKVLDDVLAGKIPALQDLKDSKGDTSGSTSPALAADASPSPAPSPQPTLPPKTTPAATP